MEKILFETTEDVAEEISRLEDEISELVDDIRSLRERLVHLKHDQFKAKKFHDKLIAQESKNGNR